jgi:hypothetical protein
MPASDLQEPFLRELALTFQATRDRILTRLQAVQPGSDAHAVMEEELRGLFHGVLVIFDGGTALADQGLIRIVDESGVPFVRYLHEIGFGYWYGTTG